MKFENKMYGNVFALFDEYSYNIKSVNIFSKFRGLWEAFLKLQVQLMFSVNGTEIRGHFSLIRSLYLLTIGERIIIAPGHTQWHTHTHTHIRYDSSGWPGLRRNLYLTTQNTHKTEISMTPAGFETAIPTSERPQTHALESVATDIRLFYFTVLTEEPQ